MAEPTDISGDVMAALEAVAHTEEKGTSLAEARKRRDASRRVEALTLRLAGLTNEQIAERLSISPMGVSDLLARSLSRAENKQVEAMREIEGQRLDRAQAAIWSQVLGGDLRAIQTFLQISGRRSKLFGLDAPAKIDLSVHVRAEMEQALQALERVVLEGEVISSSTDSDSDSHSHDDQREEAVGDAADGARGRTAVESG